MHGHFLKGFLGELTKISSVEYRGKTFPGYNQPIANTGTSKHKMMVLAKKGGKVKLVRFGHKDYGHNISPERKANYLKRSAGIKNKAGQLTKDDKFSANYWARKILWPEGKPTRAEKTAAKISPSTKSWALARGLTSGAASALMGLAMMGAAGGFKGKSGKKKREAAMKAAVIPGLAGTAIGLGKGFAEKGLERKLYKLMTRGR